MLFNRISAGQLAPGIRKKLQKREEVEGMVISHGMPVRIGKREKRRRRAKRNLLNPLSGPSSFRAEGGDLHPPKTIRRNPLQTGRALGKGESLTYK